MLDVFVSYSRKNLDFVQHLTSDLEKFSKSVWFDKKKEPLQGIPAGSLWWDEIKHGIETADNFLMIISPESMMSPYCHAEIAHALKHEKRIVTLLYCAEQSQTETLEAINSAIDSINPDSILPDNVSADISKVRSLARRNWLKLSQIQFVSYVDVQYWEQWLKQVVDAVDLDIQWVRTWGQFRQAVQIWAENDYSDDFRWTEPRLKPVCAEINQREQQLNEDETNFLLSEQERLYRELQVIETSHERRRDIGDRLAVIGDTRSGVGVKEGLPDIEWLPVNVPDELRGRGVFGEKKIAFKDNRGNEYGEFALKPFYIAKYLVTYVQYQAFAESDYDDAQWWQGFPESYQPQKLSSARTKIANAPRDSISWYQSVAFSRWLDAKYREMGLFDTLSALTLNPSPTGEGLKNGVLNLFREGLESYRAMASKVMVDIARDLRQRQTNAEEIMWHCLRNRRLNGIKFRRQHPVAHTAFVVDFFSYEHRLAIELDGAIHAQQEREDLWRQQGLEDQGLRVLRFTNEQVFNDLETVLATILAFTQADSPLLRSESGEGAGGEGLNPDDWQIRLPTEWEWQWAAQNGEEKRQYPWGDWQEGYANTSEAGMNRTTAIGMYPHGAVNCGALDISGNLFEWCLSDHSDRNITGGYSNGKRKALRGGSFGGYNDYACSDDRYYSSPQHDQDNYGCRLFISTVLP